MRKLSITLAAALVIGIGAIAVWNFLLHPSSTPVEVDSLEKMPFPLPEKPSIAVLPFINMSKDKKQEYFSDGITEEIIAALSKVPRLFVIARNSTFHYKGRPVKVPQVSEKLGVRYVLEGSVGRAGDKVRITAQLVDAITGNKLFFVERDERDLKDIFALQDEITMKILTALQVKLTEKEQARVWAKGTDNIEMYLKFLKATWLLVDFKQENLLRARQLAEEAVALDPDYSPAYTTLAATYHYEVWYSLTESPAESLEKAFELAQKALAIDESSAAHQQLSVIHLLKKEFDKAVAEAELAVDLNPNSADAHANLARHLINVGRPEKGIALFEKAIRLNPFAPTWYFLNFGLAYWMMNQHRDSIETLNKGIERNPNAMFIHMALAANYIESGRVKEARASVAEIHRITPEVSLEWIAKMIPWRNKVEIDRFVDGLRKAGLK